MGYETVNVDTDGQVATIEIKPGEEWADTGEDIHWDLGEIFSDLREDTSTRVVVVTGANDEVFYTAPPAEAYMDDDGGLREATRERLLDPAGTFRTFTGAIRTHQAMAELEKPIVAKVNGDAFGFVSNVVWSCDFILATDDARIGDIHLDMGETEDDGRKYGPEWGLVPGDGGAALLPLHMPPTMAAEYLMLGTPFTAQELADERLINAAVPAAELDEMVDALVERLLDRSAFALAWTKRLITRHRTPYLNRALDAAAAYEMVNFTQLALTGEDPKSLEYSG